MNQTQQITVEPRAIQVTAAILATATSALEILRAQGIHVASVAITGRQPVLTIDRPPTFTRGALKSRRWRVGNTPFSRGMVVRTLVAPFHGCQIEWQVSEELGEVRHG